MEQQLVAEDPRFASAMRGARSGARSGKRMAIAAVSLVVGLVLIVVAVSQRWPLLAVPGFLLALSGVYYGISRPAAPAGQQQSARSSGQGRSSRSGGDALYNRLEQRWDRRRGEQQN